MNKNYLNHPEIICCLNNYLSKKCKTILLAVSKDIHGYLDIPSYHNKMILLDTSPLKMIKMFIDYYPTSKFNDMFRSLKLFKYTRTRFHHWNKIHWNLVTTFLIYRYTVYEYYDDYPFLWSYFGYINELVIMDIYSNYEPGVSIYEIYNVVNKYNHLPNRGMILL